MRARLLPLPWLIVGAASAVYVGTAAANLVSEARHEAALELPTSNAAESDVPELIIIPELVIVEAGDPDGDPNAP